VKIRFSAEARSDLKEIYNYIASDSTKHARLTRAKLIVRAEELAQFPYAGRKNHKYEDVKLREVFIGNYRIAYYIEEQVITILTIHHTAMNDRSSF
jgi:addiction module RelE/StbE family toxin